MADIQTLYVANHSHTDIGFTDYQDVCFRQHREFVDDALDLVEATADYPEGARYRWTCEVTGTLLRWLRSASPSQLERFRHWHERGAIDVAGMPYNLTPLLNVEQLCRSLYPLRALRDDYGLSVRTAMQCDVNGISWLFADLLPAAGLELVTMAVNEVRGRAPRPLPAAFQWEGPAGGRLIAWNGFHYLFGRSIAKLGDWRFVEDTLPGIIQKLATADYPFGFLWCQSTHPMRVDNGPPDRRMADFVRRWNEDGRSPRIAFSTPSELSRLLTEGQSTELPIRRGDWTDWWSDGVASSAYETGVNRTTHELLLAAEAIASWLAAEGNDGWDVERVAAAYEAATLYDEHTWGAFASIAAPDSLFAKAQWSRKSSFAYEAAMETHDVLARTSRLLADSRAERAIEGRFNLGELADEDAYPRTDRIELLVVNTLPWPRTALVEEPDLRGGGAPVGMLEQFFPPNVPWGGALPHQRTRRVRAELPGFGYVFVSPGNAASSDDLRAHDNVIENAYYRVEVDPATGAVASWSDKELEYDFAGEHRGWRLGAYVYETLDPGHDRDALFHMDFSRDDFGTWQVDPPFRYQTASSVRLGSPEVHEGVVSIEAEIEAPGVRRARCRYRLESGRRSLALEWLLEKEHVTDPESVYIAFPLALDEPRFRLDLNGVPCSPDEDQLEGAVRDWYPIRRWADVSDTARGVTVAPLDAPLVQLGGITTGKAARQLKPEGSTIMSWVLNNHWMVNFKATQGGEIPLRYRLTTHAGGCDDARANRWAAEAATPPIVLRDYVRRGASSGSLATVHGEDAPEVTAKPADDGDGVIFRLRNIGGTPRTVSLELHAGVPASACLTSPIEEDRDPLTLDGGVVAVPVGAGGLATVRVRFPGSDGVENG